jgi:sugar/nucleoside kinase (ribokinase family)
MRRSYAVRLVTLGDLLLDVIVRLDEALVPGDDQLAHTHVGAGGQAANVAAWAAALGADARFVGKRGADDAGTLVVRALADRGVEVVGPTEGRTGVVVSLASAGDRTMASDRGSAPDLRPHELDPLWFDCDVLHLSGYSLLREPIAAAAVAAARHARGRGARVSVDVSTFTLVDDAFRARVREVAPDVVFANERERAALGETAAEWVLKRGADGISVGGVEHAAFPVDVVDATGAGDALAAGFLVGGPELGLEAAARCVAQMGTMP